MEKTIAERAEIDLYACEQLAGRIVDNEKRKKKNIKINRYEVSSKIICRIDRNHDK